MTEQTTALEPETAAGPGRRPWRRRLLAAGAVVVVGVAGWIAWDVNSLSGGELLTVGKDAAERTEREWATKTSSATSPDVRHATEHAALVQGVPVPELASVDVSSGPLTYEYELTGGPMVFTRDPVVCLTVEDREDGTLKATAETGSCD